jgi:hypothetical protein
MTVCTLLIVLLIDYHMHTWLQPNQIWRELWTSARGESPGPMMGLLPLLPGMQINSKMDGSGRVHRQNRWRFVSDFAQVWWRRPFYDSPAAWKLPRQTAFHFFKGNPLSPTLQLSKGRQFPCAEGAWPFQPLCYSKGCEKPTGSNIVPSDPRNQQGPWCFPPTPWRLVSLGAAAVERRCKLQAFGHW